MKFILAHIIRCRVSKSFEWQNFKKSNKFVELLGNSQIFLGKWIIHQLHGDMTIENYGSIWCNNRCYPLANCNLSLRKVLFRYNEWVVLRPMFINQNSLKGSKIGHQIFLLQGIKSNYFLK